MLPAPTSVRSHVEGRQVYNAARAIFSIVMAVAEGGKVGRSVRGASHSSVSQSEGFPPNLRPQTLEWVSAYKMTHLVGKEVLQSAALLPRKAS